MTLSSLQIKAKVLVLVNKTLHKLVLLSLWPPTALFLLTKLEHTDFQFKFRAFALAVPPAWNSHSPDIYLPVKPLGKYQLLKETCPDSPVYYNNLSSPPRTPHPTHPALGSSPDLHGYHLLTYYSICVFILFIVDCLGSAPLGSVIDISNSVCPKLNHSPTPTTIKPNRPIVFSEGRKLCLWFTHIP